jgi:hypothetical protein
MRSATCLTLLAIGATLTFAVTGHPSFLNLQILGLVIMATGLAGLLLPRCGRESRPGPLIARREVSEPALRPARRPRARAIPAPPPCSVSERRSPRAGRPTRLLFLT